MIYYKCLIFLYCLEVLKMAFKIKTKYNGPGVYAIIDIYNFKVYIGSSQNVLLRGKNHLSLLKRKKHNIKELQKDYDNKNDFDFILIEKANCSTRKRLLKEYCYIYLMIKEGFSIYNSYGKTEAQIKDIIIHNTLITICEHSYIYNYLSDKYKGYRDIKTSHNRTNKPG